MSRDQNKERALKVAKNKGKVTYKGKPWNDSRFLSGNPKGHKSIDYCISNPEIK
jgi:hypothetical protein